MSLSRRLPLPLPILVLAGTGAAIGIAIASSSSSSSGLWLKATAFLKKHGKDLVLKVTFALSRLTPVIIFFCNCSFRCNYGN